MNPNNETAGKNIATAGFSTLLVFVASIIFINPAYAQDLFFHMHGEIGSREAYFAHGLVLDRTPASMMLGPIEVKQLDVTVVYENEQKPEWADMRLQFQCVVKHEYDGKKAPQAPAFDEPVTMRLGEGGSYIRRSDLKIVDSKPSEWQKASSPILLKAHKLACNEAEIKKAMRDSFDGKNFSQSKFNQKIEPLGLVNEVVVIPSALGVDVLDMAWNQLWEGYPRPDPSGRWASTATPEQRAEAMRQIAAIKKQMDSTAQSLRSTYEPRVQEQVHRFDFDEKAAKLRSGQRQMSKTEERLIMVWQSKTEAEVVATMGRPVVTEAGGLRFLSYGQGFDNTQTVVDAKTGETWRDGIYNNCDLQFVTMSDAYGVHRVADIRVESDGSNVGIRRVACDGLLQAPGN